MPVLVRIRSGPAVRVCVRESVCWCSLARMLDPNPYTPRKARSRGPLLWVFEGGAVALTLAVGTGSERTVL